MRSKPTQDRRCSYVVTIDATTFGDSDLRHLSEYFSTLAVASCEVIVFDASPRSLLDENRRVLRWVARHVAVAKPFDIVRAAADAASCEKVIIADLDVRYGAAEIEQLCCQLDLHEVVEPQDYFDPLPWWGGIEAARMLVNRGVEPRSDRGATFGFRRSAVTSLRPFEFAGAIDPLRRLALFGAEVFSADVFVQRRPPALAQWLRNRPAAADEEFVMPVKTAFFFALLPMLMLLAFAAGARVTAGYAGAVAFGSIVLAARGRSGAASAFPVRACFYAPLWLAERSISVYWALVRRIRRAAAEPATPVFSAARDEKVASGE